MLLLFIYELEAVQYLAVPERTHGGARGSPFDDRDDAVEVPLFPSRLAVCSRQAEERGEQDGEDRERGDGPPREAHPPPPHVEERERHKGEERGKERVLIVIDEEERRGDGDERRAEPATHGDGQVIEREMRRRRPRVVHAAGGDKRRREDRHAGHGQHDREKTIASDTAL